MCNMSNKLVTKEIYHCKFLTVNSEDDVFLYLFCL